LNDFGFRLLVRDVADASLIETATPRALLITTGATASPDDPNPPPGKTFMIHAGQIRFGQDADGPDGFGEDPTNEPDPDTELDGIGSNSPRTVGLQLRGPVNLSPSQFEAAGAFAAHSDLFVTTSNTFGATVERSAVRLMQPDASGKQLDSDLWLLANVFIERETNGSSQINRMAYQACVVLDDPPAPFKTSRKQESIMHSTDFVTDLDTSRGDQVSAPALLNIGIQDGVQSFPLPKTDESANRLLIFTGTAICPVGGDGDGEPTRGVVRVRLNFKLPDSVRFVGSATVAALASIHGEDDEDSTFAVDSAQTIVGPSDQNTIPPPANGSTLPENELYLIVDAAVIGADAILNRISYQANVLVRDTNPDLEAILVGPHGATPVDTSVSVQQGREWDYRLKFTGPIVADFEAVVVSTSNPTNVPIASGPGLAGSTLVEIPKPQQFSGNIAAPKVALGGSATITASFTRRDGGVTVRTATVAIIPLN
jgi:hypothetical protein